MKGRSVTCPCRKRLCGGGTVSYRHYCIEFYGVKIYQDGSVCNCAWALPIEFPTKPVTIRFVLLELLRAHNIYCTRIGTVLYYLQFRGCCDYYCYDYLNRVYNMGNIFSKNVRYYRALSEFGRRGIRIIFYFCNPAPPRYPIIKIVTAVRNGIVI